MLLFTTSCVKDEPIVNPVLVKKLTETSSDLSVEWMNLSFELIKVTPGYTPPVAARAQAYIGLCMYELLVPGMENYRSMQGKLNGFKPGTIPSVTHSDMDWGLAFNEAMYQLYGLFYRNTTKGGWDILEQHYKINFEKLSKGLDQNTITNSINYGQAQANAIYRYSQTDGQEDCSLNNYPEHFTAPNGQGLWTPSSTVRKPLQPYWGQVRTFINYNQVRTETLVPPQFSQEKSSVIYTHALEVRNKVENLSKEEVQMVKYWNDEQENSITPAGHMLSILGQILKTENKDLGFSAYAFMKLGIAIHDATVMTWKTKYTYFTMRPEMYIREYIDHDFLPFVNPNATPEYSSGLSSVAAASVEVLGSLFGHNYAFTDKTYEYRKDIDGSPRSFKSFDHMLTEVSSAALYGGIHYRFSIEAGERQGFDIGKGINAIR
ncbi:MAG: hypothetical protein IPM48_01060 [Saprospiraceae bacterium]|nr:hypothetical protein [Saprospiraceae bacterium]